MIPLIQSAPAENNLENCRVTSQPKHAQSEDTGYFHRHKNAPCCPSIVPPASLPDPLETTSLFSHFYNLITSKTFYGTGYPHPKEHHIHTPHTVYTCPTLCTHTHTIYTCPHHLHMHTPCSCAHTVYMHLPLWTRTPHHSHRVHMPTSCSHAHTVYTHLTPCTRTPHRVHAPPLCTRAPTVFTHPTLCTCIPHCVHTPTPCTHSPLRVHTSPPRTHTPHCVHTPTPYTKVKKPTQNKSKT